MLAAAAVAEAAEPGAAVAGAGCSDGRCGIPAGAAAALAAAAAGAAAGPDLQAATPAGAFVASAAVEVRVPLLRRAALTFQRASPGTPTLPWPCISHHWQH